MTVRFTSTAGICLVKGYLGKFCWKVPVIRLQSKATKLSYIDQGGKCIIYGLWFKHDPHLSDLKNTSKFFNLPSRLGCSWHFANGFIMPSFPKLKNWIPPNNSFFRSSLFADAMFGTGSFCHPSCLFHAGSIPVSSALWRNLISH